MAGGIVGHGAPGDRRLPQVPRHHGLHQIDESVQMHHSGKAAFVIPPGASEGDLVDALVVQDGLGQHVILRIDDVLALVQYVIALRGRGGAGASRRRRRGPVYASRNFSG